MPELQPDDFIVTNEGARALLEALLDKWSSPGVAQLFQIVNSRIANRAGKQANATKRYFETKESYDKLIDRARSIFIDRLQVAILHALASAIDELADASAEAAVNELQKPKRKRQQQHDPIKVLFHSIAIAQTILAADEGWLSQSFVAVLYYQREHPMGTGAIAEARAKYDNLSQTQRDSRLRAYRNLLEDKGIVFEEIASWARHLHAKIRGQHTIPLTQGE
jgi:hypothetical protein